MKQSLRGFTLLELSIVLVIIGLIIGGVTVGGALIRQSELQAVIKGIDTYRTAFETFRLKFNATPGDFARASQYWSGAENGSGNGQISLAGTGNELNEDTKAWQHLTFASLASLNFALPHVPHVIGQNTAAAPINGAGFRLLSMGGASGNSQLWGRDGLSIALGKPNGNYLEAGSLTPDDTASLDTKIDDGKPTLGRLTSHFGRNTGYVVTDCVPGAPNHTAAYPAGAYNLAETRETCRPFYWIR